jgi:hypothetical protein
MSTYALFSLDELCENLSKKSGSKLSAMESEMSYEKDPFSEMYPESTRRVNKDAIPFLDLLADGETVVGHVYLEQGKVFSSAIKDYQREGSDYEACKIFIQGPLGKALGHRLNPSMRIKLFTFVNYAFNSAFYDRVDHNFIAGIMHRTDLSESLETPIFYNSKLPFYATIHEQNERFKKEKKN